jgi:phosphoserine phosphatase
VDGVLTDVPVNMQLATLFRIEKQLELIEDKFYKDGDTDAFNRAFSPLFRSAGFTETTAKDVFDQVELRNRAVDLLDVQGADLYLVSSGPSYYLDILANTHHLDIDTRCKYSRYSFGIDGTLSSVRYVAVGEAAKKTFVRSNVDRYALTVGIGNSVQLDGAFLALCTIPILVGSLAKGFLCVKELDPVIDMISALKI